MSNHLKIICVLRSGGDYDVEYVTNLKKGLDRHIGYRTDWNLVCFTDMLHEVKEAKDELDGVEIVPLEFMLPGWWSKLEIFKYTGPCLFFDLDTLIMNDISPLMDKVFEMGEKDFLMLEAFGINEGWASAVMAWNGDWHQILSDFNPKNMRYYRGDQNYISETVRLPELETNLDTVQNIIKGVYSYKYHCLANCPPNATIVCFHGDPRPRGVLWIRWIKVAWTGSK